MKTLVRNGVPGADRDSVPAAVRIRIVRENESGGRTRTSLDLNGMDIKPCPGCCIGRIKTPGPCAIRSRQEEIIRALAVSHAFIAITPVKFGGYSPVLMKATNADAGSPSNSCRGCFGNSDHYCIGTLPFKWSTP